MNKLHNELRKIISIVKTVDDFIGDHEIKDFFMNTIDDLLLNYEPGNPEYKPDVLQQMKEITQSRTEKHKATLLQEEVSAYKLQLSEQSKLMYDLIQENNGLREKNSYLDGKIKELIVKAIQNKKNPNENII